MMYCLYLSKPELFTMVCGNGNQDVHNNLKAKILKMDKCLGLCAIQQISKDGVVYDLTGYSRLLASGLPFYILLFSLFLFFFFFVNIILSPYDSLMLM